VRDNDDAALSLAMAPAAGVLGHEQCVGSVDEEVGPCSMQVSSRAGSASERFVSELGCADREAGARQCDLSLLARVAKSLGPLSCVALSCRSRGRGDTSEEVDRVVPVLGPNGRAGSRPCPAAESGKAVKIRASVAYNSE
jgi:hypothetical protein